MLIAKLHPSAVFCDYLMMNLDPIQEIAKQIYAKLVLSKLVAG